MRISDWSSDVCSSDLRTRLESALAQGRDAATMQLRSQIESGEIKQIVEGGDGHYYAIRGDGSRIATSVPVPAKKIGEASCRERGCQYGYISVVAGSLKKKIKQKH